eukprot:Gregarina_sp_Pseudo_9__1968@NODE_235_length_3477_cov_20_663176_g219_i0_p2_GENE_NODE_235_length_3477_cov_20_663176_g219_i0NODE_235_length_3477_cov_20_663176_g219_i0_p2_ORF_typecomplete_len275_score107_87PNP_UDP_1/PF01048_20/1_5e36_NODE_235_length_3477_cov_20_663176_g219_i020602884
MAAVATLAAKEVPADLGHQVVQTAEMIAIVAAMDSELTLLRSRLGDEQEETASGVSFYLGEIAEHRVVLMRSGIGKVNAALSLGLLCERYKPTLIVNTGCAGGLGDGDAPGDLIVATECTYGDVNATFFGYALGQVPGMPRCYQADERVVALLRECFKDAEDETASLDSSSTKEETASPLPEGRVRFGQLLTTDSFISDNQRRRELKTAFADGLAVDMEGCAMAQVAFRYQVPFVALRSLSDTATDDASSTYKDFLGLSVKRASDALILLLSKL